ncbi:MAG: DUF7288 family protein [Halohasta sp.]
MRRYDNTDRGQAHTVEAFIAALLLVSGLLFAMQATAVTPLSASTSNQHIENQQRALSGDLLSTAAADGSLQEAVLYWNTSRDAFEDSPDQGYYTDSGSQTDFLSRLNDTLAERRIAYNVRLRVHNTTGTPSRRTISMVEMGQPSDNAVTASRTVTLYDNDRLTGENDCELESCSFYAPDADSGLLYNRVEVRVTTWRM